MDLLDKFGREWDYSWLEELGEPPQEIGEDDERELGFIASSSSFRDNFYTDDDDIYKSDGGTR